MFSHPFPGSQGQLLGVREGPLIKQTKKPSKDSCAFLPADGFLWMKRAFPLPPTTWASHRGGGVPPGGLPPPPSKELGTGGGRGRFSWADSQAAQWSSPKHSSAARCHLGD